MGWFIRFNWKVKRSGLWGYYTFLEPRKECCNAGGKIITFSWQFGHDFGKYTFQTSILFILSSVILKDGKKWCLWKTFNTLSSKGTIRQNGDFLHWYSIQMEVYAWVSAYWRCIHRTKLTHRSFGSTLYPLLYFAIVKWSCCRPVNCLAFAWRILLLSPAELSKCEFTLAKLHLNHPDRMPVLNAACNSPTLPHTHNQGSIMHAKNHSTNNHTTKMLFKRSGCHTHFNTPLLASN